MNNNVFKTLLLASTAFAVLPQTATAETSLSFDDKNNDSLKVMGASQADLALPEDAVTRLAEYDNAAPSAALHAAQDTVQGDCPVGTVLQADKTCMMASGSYDVSSTISKPLINAPVRYDAQSHLDATRVTLDSLTTALAEHRAVELAEKKASMTARNAGQMGNTSETIIYQTGLPTRKVVTPAPRKVVTYTAPAAPVPVPVAAPLVLTQHQSVSTLHNSSSADDIVARSLPTVVPLVLTQHLVKDNSSNDSVECRTATHGCRDISKGVNNKKVAPNTEGDVYRDTGSVSGFKISVDGDTVAGDGFNYEAGQRKTDLALYNANIQIKNDGLDNAPYLNIAPDQNSMTASRIADTKFHTFWNYGAFIEKAEVRIFEAGASVRSSKPITLPVVNGIATLRAGVDVSDELIYVLRVYDKKGRFDETEAKPLTMVDTLPKAPKVGELNKALTSYGIDRASVRNIRLKGSMITVHGVDVPEGGRVRVMGQDIPMDSDGDFVRQMILPYGDHNIDVDIMQNGRSASFNRDVHLSGTDFFYVAIGDVTLGNQSGTGPANFLASSDEDFSEVYLNGRGAMYAKGRVKGGYEITAAMDTGEERLDKILTNLDQKDPRQLLRRLDGDRFYPVYGDDSTTVEDAPTQGRFYVKVEKDDSHIMWGNFATQITTTEFAHLDRGLYGAIADYNSNATTAYGDRKVQATAFAADPGTLPSREEFRGTGGSIYFLQRQDLSIGSERLRVEVRDKVSGLVVSTRELRPQEDYDVDYIQGRILLSEPLAASISDQQIVRDGSMHGNELHLVVRYEYSPSLADVGGFTTGGRVTGWVGNNIRLGATAQKEETGSADQRLLGADLILQSSPGTYIKGEVAQTKGAGFGQRESSNGGFDFNNINSAGVANETAIAYRVEAGIDLDDVSGQKGTASAYFDHQDAGFSGTGRVLQGETERWGAAINTSLGETTKLAVKYDEIDSDVRGGTRAIYGDVSQQIGAKTTVSLGARHEDTDTTAYGASPAVNGSRTDVSGQLDYAVSNDVSLYAFAQGTVDRDATRSKNDRIGLGASVNVNDHIRLTGEVSEGTGGLGANAQATYTRSDASEFYLGYALSPDRSDIGNLTQSSVNFMDQGTVTFGGRTRYKNALSVYGEERLGFGSTQSSQTHAYGVTFNPTETWTLGASVENGVVKDDFFGNFDRTAFSVSAGRSTESLRLATNLEARFEDGVQAGSQLNRTTWLMRNTVAYDANQNWELLGRLNFAISDSDQSDFLNSDFVEGVLGAAYRPVNNDRLNALMKYTYFEDLAPAGQVSAGGTVATPRQKSQVFSVDAIYDISKRFSLGGKYGYRSGEVAFDRSANNTFIKSDAHLAVARLDYHVTSKWDVLAEGRILKSSLADDERLGALFGVYRHFDDNVKLGLGWNFAKFSDDLTDFNDDSDGAFVNLVGKF